MTPDEYGLLHGTIETDMVCMGIPVFFIRTADMFLELTRAAVPNPVPVKPLVAQACRTTFLLRTPLRPPKPGENEMTEFANRYPPARLAVIMNNNPFVPESYATCTYRPVHAFVLTTGRRAPLRPLRVGAGGRRAVGVRRRAAELPPPGAARPSRRGAGRVRAAHADGGAGRRHRRPHEGVDQGVPQAGPHGASLGRRHRPRPARRREAVYDPTSLVPGIEVSDDEILRVRAGSTSGRGSAGWTGPVVPS